MDNVHFERVAIIGVGLIGGSLALNLRAKGLTSRIVGIGRGKENLDTALRLGIIDEYSQDVKEGVRDADLIVVAVPVLKTADVIRECALNIMPGAIITDVGSVKGAVIDAVAQFIPKGAHFVPGHPIAGTEHSGAASAFLTLYEGKRCILTPTPSTDKGALNAVKRVWEAAGSEVVIMDAKAHDEVLAAVSHLPHIIAYSLVNTVAGVKSNGDPAIKYSAGGFKDFTRIASSSPEMWSDICAMNKTAIIDMIGRFEDTLSRLKALVKNDGFNELEEEFAKAKGARDSLLKGNKDG